MAPTAAPIDISIKLAKLITPAYPKLNASGFRNAAFIIQDWSYSNLLILLISVLVTYIWVIKNKT